MSVRCFTTKNSHKTHNSRYRSSHPAQVQQTLGACSKSLIGRQSDVMQAEVSHGILLDGVAAPHGQHVGLPAKRI